MREKPCAGSGFPVNRSASRLTVAMALIVFCYLFYTFYLNGDGNATQALIFMLLRLTLCLLAVTLVFVNMRLKEQLLWILLVASFGVSYIIHSSGLEYFCNTIVFLGTVSVLPKVRLKRVALDVLTVIYVAFSVFVLALYALKPGKVNSNSAAQVCFCFTCLIFSLTMCSKQKLVRRTLYVLALFTTALCFTYKSRATLLGLLVLYFALVFGLYKKRKFARRAKFIFASVFIVSILFAYFYAVTLYNMVGDKNITIFGKSLYSGRAILWRTAFDVIKTHFAFGVGNSLVVDGSYAGEEVINLHNQTIGYAVVFGVPFTVAFIWLFSLAASRLVKSGGRFSTLILLSFSVVAWFETCMYSTTALFVSILIIIVYQTEIYHNVR